jgi:hypothetical protein
MMRKLAPLPLALLVAALAGCEQPQPARMRLLGNVDPQLAFATAKDVMSQYFDIQSADPDTFKITSRPKNVQDYKERLLGASPTRQTAWIQIVRTEGQTAAQVAVSIQQLGSPVYRSMGNESYSGVPNQTPADIEGATTVEQNQTWKTIGTSFQVERNMLDDLYRRLHPEAKEQAP